MLCEKCKHNMATVHYKQSVNGEINQYYLCEHCANEMQINASFDNMFSEFLSEFTNPMTFTKKLSAKPACPSCGMTFDEIRSLGRFGCGDCYSTFSNEVDSVLRNIHGTSRHNGKYPNSLGSEMRIKSDIAELRHRLKKAVEEEQYEEAARLRDKIKELKGGVGNE